MICPKCGSSERFTKAGYNRHGNPRRQCKACEHIGSISSFLSPVKPVDAPNVSSYVRNPDPDSPIKAQWIKNAAPDKNRALEILQEAAKELSQGLPKAAAVPAPESVAEDLCDLYVITDYHFGMLADPEETMDAAWDLKIAEKTLTDWFAVAISTAPDAEVGIFCQLGDFLHWDGLEAVTPTSKHVLDADTRFPKLVQAVIRCTLRVIGMLLEKHPKVHVIMAEGNHDPASSVWMRGWLEQIYQDEPRVTVDTSRSVFYAYRWGDVSLFFHHGHKVNLKSLPDAIAANFREMIGETTHSEAHAGHYHQKHVITHALMCVYQHETLAPRDAYAARGGFPGGRSADVITYHKKHGRVATQTIRPEMLAA